MNAHSARFIERLRRLSGDAQTDVVTGQSTGNPGAMANLRRSLAHEPGEDYRVYRYIEPFLDPSWKSEDGRRKAHYVVAGLYALHPCQEDSTLACSFGSLFFRQTAQGGDGAGIEKRFMALLGADDTNIHLYLRQAISLLKAGDIGCNYADLLEDLGLWMNRVGDALELDRLRQRWARDFYRDFADDMLASASASATATTQARPGSESVTQG